MMVFPIIVTYNTDLENCDTYTSLLSQYNNLEMLVYDNSPTPINQKYKTDLIHYYHDKGNSGIAVAYNYGALLVEHIGGYKSILLLDQDTTFEKDYLYKLEFEINNNKDIKVFVPQIKLHDGKPFSPVHHGIFKSKSLNLAHGTYSFDKYLPVNSGACIDIKVFERNSGYNEKLKLDFTDFDFFLRLSKITKIFKVVNSVAWQDFSNEKKDVEALFRRYTIYIECSMNTYKPLRRASIILVLRHTIALTLRTRNLCFIKYYICKYILRR